MSAVLRGGQYRIQLNALSGITIFKSGVFVLLIRIPGLDINPLAISLCQAFRAVYNSLKGIFMQNNFRLAVNLLKSHPIFDNTQNLAGLDSGFAALFQSAEKHISEPTMLLTQARNFKTLFAKCFNDCPAFVLWLPTEHSADIYDLARTTPLVYRRTSPDLQERDMMMTWGHSDFTFASFAGLLLPFIESQKNGGAIPMIFATDRYATTSVLPVDLALTSSLALEASRQST